jgi:putative ABC transport system permease protein
MDMDHALRDLRSGIRMVIKYPMLSSVAVLTLGLGIGLSTTVFSVVNGGLFKGLPFPDADRIVSLVTTNPSQSQPQQQVTVHNFAEFLVRQTSFEQFGAFAAVPLNLSNEEGRPERYTAGHLTVSAFETLGVQPIDGRGFVDGDDRPGGAPVILIGYNLWQQRFGGAANIVGTTIRAEGTVRTIVGVMPETFAFPFQEQLWVPLVVDPLATPRGEGPSYGVVGRLTPDVTLARPAYRPRPSRRSSRQSFRRPTPAWAQT